ncbi:MAG: MraY family glycosyltransferase [Anaerovoracaceae bacterium]|nr:MraY family glycosyltransferase [Bacillota bacterium]MDY2670506.1 MraY family glycosyltransferase [Anaerovoracaceae bacterium]
MKYLLIVLLAFAIACVVTPFAIKLAPKIGAMDIPRDKRRMHTKPMPRFGGMSMFLGTEIALLVFLHSDPKVIAILIGGVCIYAVGVADDIKGLPAKLKFALQILSAIVVYIGGIQIDFVKNPLNPQTYLFFPGWLSFVITIIWIVGITNTVNLIDGLDGLAAGVAAIASGCIAYSAILSGQYEVGLAMFAVSGGALGFLPYNFHPAKIFMGDSGSLFLGFMIACISILGSTKGATLIATIVPFLVLGLPIFDTAFAIIRRWVNGYPIMEADKGHLHHRIMNTGMGQRRTVLIMYSISAIMGMVAILVVQRMFIESTVLIAVAVILVCVFIADRDSMKEILQEGIPPEKIGMLNHKSKEQSSSQPDVSSADGSAGAETEKAAGGGSGGSRSEGE